MLPSSVELKRSVLLSRASLKIHASAASVMDQSVSEASSRAPTIVEVDLGNRSYPIYIGSGLLDQPDLLQRYCVLIVSYIISLFKVHFFFSDSISCNFEYFELVADKICFLLVSYV